MKKIANKIKEKDKQGKSSKKPSADEDKENLSAEVEEEEETDVRLPSRVFQVGILYERYHKQGVSRKDFLSLLDDLGDQGAHFLRKNRLNTNVDFDGGRLFQRFSQEDKTIMSGKGFLAMLSHVKEEKGLIYGEFEAGRVFERYAKTQPQKGLLAVEFQDLMRESRLGALLQQLKSSMVDIFDDSGIMNENLYRADEHMGISSEETVGENFQRNGISKSKSSRPLSDERQTRKKGSKADRWLNSMKQLERTEQQLEAYQQELASELELKKELPEAYSASKESLLTEHIHTLSLQRDLLGKELQELYSPKYMQPSAVSDLQYYSTLYHQLPVKTQPPHYYPSAPPYNAAYRDYYPTYSSQYRYPQQGYYHYPN